MPKYDFVERCLEFSVKVSQLLDSVNRDRFGPKMRDQLLASSSSIGANMSEAQSAQSRADYVSKFEIALKEARETGFRLAHLRRVAPQNMELEGWLTRECYEMTAILVASVKTLKANGVGRTGRSEIRDQPQPLIKHAKRAVSMGQHRLNQLANASDINWTVQK